MAAMPTALALLPHLDDEVFSCGRTLAVLADAGWGVLPCTVFTASVPNPTGFTLACQTDKGFLPEADYMALRRAEDAAAAAQERFPRRRSNRPRTAAGPKPLP